MKEFQYEKEENKNNFTSENNNHIYMMNKKNK